MSRSRYSAILGAMGLTEQRLVFLSEIVAFLKSNRDFSEKDYYRKQKFNLGDVVPARQLPRSLRFTVEEVKDGKPTVLKLFNGPE